jgi:hypothetical protein
VISQIVCAIIKIIGCRNKGRRKGMVENDDVRTPSGMVDEDVRSTRSSRTEIVERGWLQEGLKTWQGLNLGNKLVAIIQKLSLLHHETTEWIYFHGSTVSIIIVDVR